MFIGATIMTYDKILPSYMELGHYDDEPTHTTDYYDEDAEQPEMIDRNTPIVPKCPEYITKLEKAIRDIEELYGRAKKKGY
jgi:hypothetical protein